MRQKNEQELAVMKEELEIRKRKMEERQRSNDQMKKFLSKYTITVANINRIFKLYEQVFTIITVLLFFKAAESTKKLKKQKLKNRQHQMPQTLSDVVVQKSLATSYIMFSLWKVFILFL